MGCRFPGRVLALSRFCRFATAWLILSFNVSPALANDEIERLEYDANSFADQGRVAESLRKIDQAMGIATREKRPAELIDRLNMRKTALFFADHLMDKGFASVRALLARKSQIKADMNKDPEIGVVVDDILTALMNAGAETHSLDALKLARVWCESFSQFDQRTKDQVYREIFSYYAQRKEWSQAEEAAGQMLHSSGPQDRAALARAYYACRMQHKEKDAAIFFNRLGALSSDKPGGLTWCIFQANWLNDAGFYTEALPLAEKACAAVASTPFGKEGNSAVSQAHSIRASIELGMGRLPQAEADARKALKAAGEPGTKGYSHNSTLLENILRIEHKFAEVEKVRQDRQTFKLDP